MLSPASAVSTAMYHRIKTKMKPLYVSTMTLYISYYSHKNIIFLTSNKQMVFTMQAQHVNCNSGNNFVSVISVNLVFN